MPVAALNPVQRDASTGQPEGRAPSGAEEGVRVGFERFQKQPAVAGPTVEEARPGLGNRRSRRRRYEGQVEAQAARRKRRRLARAGGAEGEADKKEADATLYRQAAVPQRRGEGRNLSLRQCQDAAAESVEAGASTAEVDMGTAKGHHERKVTSVDVPNERALAKGIARVVFYHEQVLEPV